jgi:hypothetical protein
MNAFTPQPTWLETRADRRHLSVLGLLLLAGTSGACKPGPPADDAGGTESTDQQESTTSDASTDDTTTTGDGDGDGEPDCLPNDECPCAPGDDLVVGLSSGKLESACARFADGSLSCWGNYESMIPDASIQWWPSVAFKLHDPRCPTLPLRRYPRLTIPGGLLGVSTDPTQILGLDAEHRVGAVLSPKLAALANGLVSGTVDVFSADKLVGWPEGSLAPEAAFVEVETAWYTDSGRACARTDEGEVCCWGDPGWGTANLGLPDWPTDAYFPEQAPDGACWLDLATPAVGMHLLEGSTCVWDSEGALRCWGHYNFHGILGYGNSDPVGAGLTPAELPPVPVQGKVVALDPPCAVLDDGRLTCWSWAAQWLGSALALPEDVGADQAPVVDVGFPALGVTVGGGPMAGPQICAWSADGRGKCWGEGEVPWFPSATCRHGGGPPCDDRGDDEPIASLPELSFGSPIRQIVNNGRAVLVLLDDGRVQCWGHRSQCPIDDGADPDVTPHTPQVAANELPPLNFHCDCAD